MVSVSISKIVEGVLALSALRCTTNRGSRPEMLNRDNEPALRRTTRDILARLVLRLLPIVVNTDLAETDTEEKDIVTIEFDIPATAEKAVCAALEAAVTNGLLATAYPSSDMGIAELCHKEYEAAAEVILAMRRTDLSARIRPQAA